MASARSYEAFIAKYPPQKIEHWLDAFDASAVTELSYSDVGPLGPHINVRRNGWQACPADINADSLCIFRFPLNDWLPWHWFRSPWERCARYLGLTPA